MNKIKVLVAENGEVFREGLAKALESKPEIEIVAKCSTGLETIQKATEYLPDIVILDAGISESEPWDSLTPRFIELSQSIKQLLPKTYIVITHSHRYSNIATLLEAEGHAYLDKLSSRKTLLLMIEGLIKGEAFLSHQTAAKILEDFALSKKKTEGIPREYDFALSEREMEILALISQKGISNKQIAGTLFISESTVKTHLSNILQKMHARSRQQAVALAKEKGLIFKKDRKN